MKKICLFICCSTVAALVNANTYIDGDIGLNTTWSSIGLNADVGYLFNRYFALEGGLTYSPGYSYSWSPGTSYSSNYWMIDAAAKGILPLSNVFSLYGKLGVGFNNYSSWSNQCNGCSGPDYSGTNIGILYGVGGKFNLSSQWSLHLEDYTVSGPNPNFLMFGGEFRF